MNEVERPPVDEFLKNRLGGQNGDTRFDRLVRPHLASAFCVARAIVSSEDLAWDVVQESLLSLWRLKTTPLHIRAWLIRAVVNRSLHLLRTRRRCHTHERIACSECGRSRASSPAAHIELEELRSAVLSTIRSLPSNHRRILELREIDELDYGEVAARLGLPIGTVRSRLNRARSVLKSQLRIRFAPDE